MEEHPQTLSDHAKFLIQNADSALQQAVETTTQTLEAGDKPITVDKISDALHATTFDADPVQNQLMQSSVEVIVLRAHQNYLSATPTTNIIGDLSSMNMGTSPDKDEPSPEVS